ncbi:alpha-L-fucosidase [Microlunatus flavus]|uniref:alpha-L-fucosidase n=1 Tax=Microlunatus flavus TaxID=1036181 RepID=A0A1H9B1D1_9ACTN|nr:alpha-L-fucosidase [Microlunatus flavus]SEP82635.1 alpha-L-fucosidase [Microlunatus flavus]
MTEQTPSVPSTIPSTRVEQTDTPELWASLQRPLPDWYAGARFGIFIHWGAYSVPAWAEPSGALGLVPEDVWFAHNAYAEWYFNTIRIAGSPAQQRHQELYGGAPYDDFLDAWSAADFDPADWARLFASAGAEYVIPTTKHHDGIALWDAPGTGARNTVHRGPKRDLIADIADAVRAEGLRFGVYYSGGLDWSTSVFPPHTKFDEVSGLRPRDAAYNLYALRHVQDLVHRYSPSVLWNDIEWPDAGKRGGPDSLHALFEEYYAAVPDGVVNDRWGDTHHDFATSEYEYHLDSEDSGAWENTRGIGFSFGYNQAEDESQSLDANGIAKHLTDVVSRGGRLLLDVGPTAEGTIPGVQRRALEGLARWMGEAAPVLRSSSPAPAGLVQPSQTGWVRWLATPGHLVAAVDGGTGVDLGVGADAVDVDGLRVLNGSAELRQDGGRLTAEVTPTTDGPALLVLPTR